MDRPCEDSARSGAAFLYARILSHFSAYKIHASEYPAEPPLRPVCTRPPLCVGCPYPANSFLCWGKNRKYLRSEMRRLDATDRWIEQKTKERIHTDEFM